MSDWTYKSLDESIRAGHIELGRGNIISKIDIETFPGPYPIYSSSAQGDGKFGEYGKFMFDEELISWSVDGGGNFFYRRKHQFSITNVSGYLRIRSKELGYPFVYYVLADQHRAIFFDYTTKAHPSVIRKLYRIPAIPKPEQESIAKILIALDETIEQTEALIAKYQQIKAGLMHDLFTRGVTPDGCLRPTRDQAPHLYKESPLGWIPKEWQCLNIEELLAKTFSPMRSGPFGSALLKDELVEEGVPFLGIDNVFAERFVPHFRRFVSRQKFAELLRYSVFPRDVIITIMGTVGRCCIVPDYVKEALSSKHLWTMTFDTDRVLPELVCWQLNYAGWVQNWFARYSQGAVMEAIQSSTLKHLPLPVPERKEQNKILDLYSQSTRHVERECEQVTKLRQLKLGLMHDLLTGRVRVKVAEAAA